MRGVRVWHPNRGVLKKPSLQLESPTFMLRIAHRNALHGVGREFQDLPTTLSKEFGFGSDASLKTTDYMQLINLLGRVLF